MILIFCPTFPAAVGSFDFARVELSDVVAMVGEDPQQLAWRHTFPAVKHLLRSAGITISANVDRGSTVKRSPTTIDVGDSALLFCPLGRIDLKSSALTASDFDIFRIRRTE